jgi:hypothetical protein
MKIKFCHIAPTRYLEKFTKTNGAHLILAHLIEQDPQYRDFYYNLNDGKYKIMDNSAFEMFKQGRPMYSPSKLIQMADLCRADCVILSDYPREPWEKTRDMAIETYKAFKSSDIEVFYVPQSELGDLDGLTSSIDWALNQSSIRLIGLSILSCPIALGIDEKLKHSERPEGYKLQRYLSRYTVFRHLEKNGVLSRDDRALKRFHCLGMMDGPNEIDLLRPYHQYIWSWDSSAAVWCGLNGISFDMSPTGLMNGKFEKEVDFSCNIGDDYDQLVMNNIHFINSRVM